MEDSTSSVLSYYRETVVELKQRLINKAIEMEALRVETTEELKKSQENVKQLLHLLKVACYERDEAMSKIPIGSTVTLKSSNRVANSTFTDSSNLSDISDSSNNNLLRIPPDRASLFIESVTRGKPLPQKGRLLSAVMSSGPLLQTILVVGSMPRWRNPPPQFSVPLFDGGGPVHKSYSSFLEAENLIPGVANAHGYLQMGNKLRF